ncbi:MAG: alkaline phosphatase family protein [Thiobacillaceae bacterium]
MQKKRLATAVALCLAGLACSQAYANHSGKPNNISHVLLISIDGMHALDYANCVANNTCPNLALLGQNGVNYTRAYASKPSDSFPGLMALVSGGSPRTVGAYYDVAYDRVLAPPQNTTGNGVAGGTCNAGVPNGTTTEYEEGIDLDQTQLNGGYKNYSVTDGGIQSIDPTRLPRDPYNNCKPVYPWNFVRTNTVYGVIHAAHGYTAWSDKHPAYASVSGPGKNASNLDDYYSPEINSTVIALPGVTTPTGASCATIRDPSQTGSWTDSFDNIQCYDTLKVNAILNQIDGKTHDGSKKARVPALFGMNFQAVSVGQKLIEKNVGKGGYLDATGTTSPLLQNEMVFVDAAIGQMVSELKKSHLLNSTLVIVTAKHGQSPVDPNRFVANLKNGTSPATLLSKAGYLPFSESTENPTGIGPTEDDISQLWLSDANDTQAAVDLLEANAEPGTGAAIGQIFYGTSVETQFGKPGLLPDGDPRVPDIIVQPQTGVVYTGSSKKQAEHGGFAQDDTNVMLLLSNPRFDASVVTSLVETTQVAPTILQALGLDPQSLDAVRMEGTQVLPSIFAGYDGD